MRMKNKITEKVFFSLSVAKGDIKTNMAFFSVPVSEPCPLFAEYRPTRLRVYAIKPFGY